MHVSLSLSALETSFKLDFLEAVGPLQVVSFDAGLQVTNFQPYAKSLVKEFSCL